MKKAPIPMWYSDSRTMQGVDSMKKLSLILSMIMLFAAVFSSGAFALPSDSVQVQDIYNFARTEMDFDMLETDKSGNQYRNFNGDIEDYELINSFVEALCDGPYNLNFVDSHLADYGREKFFSYALDYTGSGNVIGCMEMMFVDNVTGNLTIWGHIDGKRMEAHIYYGKGFEIVDLGIRSDGSIEDVSLPGKSLATNVLALDDFFITLDSRFGVGLNEAMIYRDGEVIETSAYFVRNQAENREELHIDNFYRNESIVLTVPYNSVMSGDIFDARTIGLNDDGGFDKYMENMDDFLHWKFSHRILGVCHNGDYFLCYQDDYNDFADVAIRFMKFDPEKDIAIIYLCLQFDTAPFEYEVLTAVSLGGTPKGAKADEVINVSRGDTFEIAFTGTEFNTHYDLYTWEILEGSSLIELTGSRNSTCTVKAYDAGTVRLKLLYEYAVDGVHPLTGNKSTDFKSKTREYVINIAP